MSEPRWVTLARQDLGLTEIPGKQTATRITKWLVGMHAWWHDDETPWCGVAMDGWMRAAGITPPAASYRARSWLKWGFPVTEPVLGTVAVLERGGAGHVTMVVGRTGDGRLLGLGGNQGDRVSIAPFSPVRVLGYRWPFEFLSDYYLQSTQLPLLAAASGAPASEA